MELTLEGVVIGVIAIVIGVALVFRGLRLFMFLLPALGFLGGFLLGAGAVEHIFGDAFLATATGWIAGFLLGLLFAAFSYFYYLAAVVVFGGILGYQLTAGALAWIGFNETGIIVLALGLFVAVVFGIAFLLLGMPTVLAIVGTAIAGAGATVAGLAVGLCLLPVAQLGAGVFGVYSSEELGWLGLLALVGLAFAGMIYQTRSVGDEVTAITAEAFQNPGMGGGNDGAGPGGAAAA